MSTAAVLDYETSTIEVQSEKGSILDEHMIWMNNEVVAHRRHRLLLLYTCRLRWR